jgi:hypothetical protein
MNYPARAQPSPLPITIINWQMIRASSAFTTEYVLRLVSGIHAPDISLPDQNSMETRLEIQTGKP